MEVLAVSDQVWLALITLGTGIVAALGAGFSGYVALKHKALDQKIDQQSEELATQSKTLAVQDRKLDNAAILGQATYTFQNHAMGLQKKALMVACEAKAKLDPTPENQKEAKLAKQDYMDHQSGQAKVDAQALISRAEEQARKVLEQAALTNPQESVAAVARDKTGGTHEIEGTIELTPKEPE